MAIDDVVVAVGGELAALAVGRLHEDIRADAVGHRAAHLVPCQFAGALLNLAAPHHLLLLEVDEDDFLRRLHLHHRLVGIGEGEIRTCPNDFLAENGVELISCEQNVIMI